MARIRLFLLLLMVAAYPARAEFRFRVVEDLGSLDWSHGEITSVVVQQLMEGLTTSGKAGEPVAALAESWKQLGPRAFVFKLRKNAVWSDGVPVCASHFVDGWNRVRSKEVASPYAHYLEVVKQATARGCHELRVELARPAGYFPALASHWVFFPVRNDLIAKHGRAWTDPANLAVTGPYVLSRWEKDVAYELKANPRYYGKAARETTLRAQVIADDNTALGLFRSGRLDWIRDLPALEKEELARLPEFSAYRSFVGYHLGFRFKGEGAPDKNARCAIATALNKREIPKVLKGGEDPAYSFVPQGLLGKTIQEPMFDAAKARALWQKAGAKYKPVELHYYAKGVHDLLMQWVQGQLKRNLGADVKLVRQEGKTYWAQLQHSPPDVFLSGTTAAYAHPYSFVSEMLSKSPANWGHFESQEYDRLAEKVALSAASAHVADKLLVERECAIVPLYFRQTVALVSRKWDGFFINPMTYVYLKEVRRKN